MFMNIYNEYSMWYREMFGLCMKKNHFQLVKKYYFMDINQLFFIF